MKADTALAPGKQRLIDAALRLAAERRGFATLGIRELARAARLNPNTFYRHFDTLEDLALEALAAISGELRPMLRHECWQAARNEPHAAPRLACEAYFAFVLEHRDAFLGALAEYHGASAAMRGAIRRVLADVTTEVADDVGRLQLMPAVPRASVEGVCAQIVAYLFHLSQDYIDAPARREALLDEAERFIVWLCAGAHLLHQQTFAG
jgi:AcrR family transcriptional regulator